MNLPFDPWSASRGVILARRSLLAFGVLLVVGQVVSIGFMIVIPFFNYSVVPSVLQVQTSLFLGLDVALFVALYQLGQSRFGGSFAKWAAWLLAPRFFVALLGLWMAATKSYGGIPGDFARFLAPPISTFGDLASTILALLAIRKASGHGTRQVHGAWIALAIGADAISSAMHVFARLFYAATPAAALGVLTRATQGVYYASVLLILASVTLAYRSLGPRKEVVAPQAGVYR